MYFLCNANKKNTGVPRSKKVKYLLFNLLLVRASYGSALQAFENLPVRQVTFSSVSPTHLTLSLLQLKNLHGPGRTGLNLQILPQRLSMMLGNTLSLPASETETATILYLEYILSDTQTVRTYLGTAWQAFPNYNQRAHRSPQIEVQETGMNVHFPTFTSPLHSPDAQTASLG